MGRQPTSCVHPFWSAEHAFLFACFPKLGLAGEILPFGLAGFEFLVGLDFARQLGGPSRPVAHFAGVLASLVGKGRVDISGG